MGDVGHEEAAARTRIVDAFAIVVLDEIVAVRVIDRPEKAARTRVGTIRTVVAQSLQVEGQGVGENGIVALAFDNLQYGSHRLAVGDFTEEFPSIDRLRHIGFLQRTAAIFVHGHARASAGRWNHSLQLHASHRVDAL